MAQTVVQLCNTALSRIGVSNYIASLSEASQEAIVCNVHYEQCRDRLLREVHWPFAKAYQTLALVTEGENTAWEAEWNFAYRYPSDALLVHRVLTANGRRETIAEPFEIGSDSVGRLIFCDQADIAIEYTRRIDDPSQFDQLFFSCLGWLLAAEIAMPLAVSENLRKQAVQMYQAERDMALRVAFNEGEQIRDLDTEFMNARGYASWNGGAPGDVGTISPSGFSIE
jgi:hypothetical protein